MADSSTLNARLASYRPVLDRVLFGMALLGVLVAVHLVIQQGRGFDRGCLGFSAPAAAAESTFDCNLVTESRAGTLLGVSNAYWGIAFYLAVAALSAAAAFAASARGRFKAARAVLIAGGLVYSAYLTYHQFVGLNALCALCLTSAALVAVLFLVQVAALMRPAAPALPAPASSEKSSSEKSSSKQQTSSMASPSHRAPRPALFAGLAVALVILVGADLTYFSRLDDAAAAGTPAQAAAPAPAAAASASASPPAPATAEPVEAPPPGREGSPVSTASADTTLPKGCRFATAESPLDDPSRLVSFTDPVYGNEKAAVTVVEFFDPNCPHCKDFHPEMQRLLDQYGDRARFVFKPLLVIGPTSINQIAALQVAAQQGKFKPMLEAQYALQQRGGLSDDQLAGIARQIGMNPDVLRSKIKQPSHRKRIIQQRKLAASMGVKATPTVVIDGRLVARRARAVPGCLPALIEQQIQQTGDGS